MEVKMAATTRILKKLSLGHLTELFHRDNNLPDIISNQQDTGGQVVHTPGHIGCGAPEFNNGRSFGRGLRNRGDFLHAFSQSKEQFIAEWKDADLGLISDDELDRNVTKAAKGFPF